VESLQAGGQRVVRVGEDLAQAGGGLEEEALAQGQGGTAEVTVDGLNAGGQRALVLGALEMPMGGKPLSEGGGGGGGGRAREGEGMLVGAGAVAVEDLREEVVRQGVVEETENGIGQRQTLTDLTFKGLHRGSSRKPAGPGGNLGGAKNLGKLKIASAVLIRP